jgi:Protein of unknown function (DUF3631)
MPSGFDNRLGDNWQLMFAIADLAGGEWPERARRAAGTISKVSETASVGTQLLSDIRTIFRSKDDADVSPTWCPAAIASPWSAFSAR